MSEVPLSLIPQLNSRFGIYVHIPYCLQRCTYCDFATYEQSQIMPPSQYVDLVKNEIRQYSHALTRFQNQPLHSIYFGGGTPSLIDAKHIVAIIQELANFGFSAGPQTEVTIEINPATISNAKMDAYLTAGINRFSVGAQSFDDGLLKSVNREHNAAQTRETLDLLKSYQVRYSFDLLFALPGQSIDMLKRDLDEVSRILPHHISPYCLTVPEGHVLSKFKLNEEIQIQMFQLISDALINLGYQRYEISNFSIPGFESKHNSLYWDDHPYWGLGLGAHSYFHSPPWGMRYWNPNSIQKYQEQIETHNQRKFFQPGEGLPAQNIELLTKAQSLTDFCHTSMRRKRGLDLNDLSAKFGASAKKMVESQIPTLMERGWVNQVRDQSWALSEAGLLVSNQVFSALTFLDSEIPKDH